MNTHKNSITEEIQKLIARLIATSSSGHGLCLVGGFRYRLLDGSCRMSADVDYHWEGDLEAKQKELLVLLTKKLLPEVKSQFGYEGDARRELGPDGESPFVKTVAVALYRKDVRASRIEIPVDIMRVACMDPPVARTVAGTVYLTTSHADMIESKVIALFNRLWIEMRDMIDIFLFRDRLVSDSPDRIRKKLAVMAITRQSIGRRLEEMSTSRNSHVRAIDEIISSQIDESARANLEAGGGGSMLFDDVFGLLCEELKLTGMEDGP